MKRAVSLILALTMLMSLVPLAKAEGLSLVPLETDETGVLPQSAFLLTGYAGDEPELILNGEKTAKAEKNPDGTFKMTFDEPFSEKELLKLQLTDGGSWAFQSAESFSVKSTVPGNNAQNVPIKSGIEFSFTHSDLDMESIKENFLIKPKTEGYWEQHKNTAVFVPTEPFEYGEEYSITLNGGAARENGTTLSDDLTVEFRTEEKSPVVGNEIFSLTPKYRYFETSSSKAPELAFYRFMTKPASEPMKIEVFPLGEEKALDWLLGNITSKSLSENLPAAMIEMECENELSKDEVDFTLPQSLENGFYAVRVSENGVSACSVIQSTDIALYMTEDSESYGIWLNDFSTGDALSGAKLYLNGGETSGETDQDGLALIPKSEDDEYIKITANGETAYYPINSYRIGKNRYHVILQTERLIYQPNDTIYVWGAVKPYADETAPEKLRLELTRGYYSATPILTEEITPEDGVFSLPIELPQVSSGSYALILKDGDEILASTYVSVYEYVKPDYKLTLTADKKAIFLGESIKYTANASFFDSTGLPDLELEAESHEFDFKNYSHTAKTDASGGISFEVLPEYTDDGQGRTSYAMNVQAVLPQEGRIYKSVYTTVLLNNISASITSGFEDGVSTVKLHSDTLTTDKVNRGEGYDYTDSPDKGREFKGTLSFMRYVEEETGTKYDYITKKTYKTYKTYEVEEKVSDVSLKTDEEGNASYSFAPTITADGYYKIKLTAVDDFSREYTVSGRVRTSDRYWKTYSRSTSVQLLADKGEYDVGDKAHLSVVKDGELCGGRYLYIRDHNGITEMKTGGGEYETVFDAAPRIYIKCVEFTAGEGYKERPSAVLEYDSENSRITIEAEAEREKYSPGDTCEIKIKTTDKDGNPVSAQIGAGVVDEAIFALREMDIDTLTEFFSDFGSCVRRAYQSHEYRNLLARGDSGGGVTSNSYYAEEPAESGYSDGDGAAVRSDFRDTAEFLSRATDKNGEAVLSFKLPDNITSWRVTLSAVNDFGAGDARLTIPVTMDAFLSCVMNETYLVGDKPYIAATLYGGALTGDEDVVFTVKIGDESFSKTAKAFERVNIALPTLEKTGDEAIVVTAEIGGKTIDAMEKKITVTDTYNRTIEETFYDSVYDEIIPVDSGNVRITFTDKNRAMLLRGIYRMRAWAGDRIDQKLANYKAKELLNEYYGAEIELEKPNFSEYQYYDGEIKLLPYSSADEELTYKIVPYIGNFIDKNLLLDYLRTKARSSSPKALYALAALGENVLDEVYALSEAENLSVTDRLYAILALCEMGDLEKAGELYERFVRDLCEEYGDEMRIVSGEDEDDILEATSLASLAALYLAPADAEKLYNYCVRNYTTDILINLEIMAYTIDAIENLPEEGGSVTYEYEGESFTKEFKGREAYSVEIPSAKLGDFKVVSASEGVVMASECEKKIDMESIDSPYVSIERKYYRDGESEPSTEFKETDIVRCEISVKYSPQALKGGYIINDYLPSGLEFFKSGGWYVSGNGQRVNISNYFYNNELSEGGSATISYYARVVSAGEYTADRAVISDASSHTPIAVTERCGVKINSVE